MCTYLAVLQELVVSPSAVLTCQGSKTGNVPSSLPWLSSVLSDCASVPSQTDLHFYVGVIFVLVPVYTVIETCPVSHPGILNTNIMQNTRLMSHEISISEGPDQLE